MSYRREMEVVPGKKSEARRKREEGTIATVSGIKNVLIVGRGCYKFSDSRPAIKKRVKFA
ncbi:hypothetical protein QUB48_25700 [Microcoleus sp. ARI1-A5]